MQETKRHKIYAKETLKIYVDTARQHKRDFLLSGFVPLGNVMLGVTLPFFASKILAGLLQHDSKTWTYFYLLIAGAILAITFNVIGIQACCRMQAKSLHDLHLTVLDRVLHRGTGFFNNQIGGKLVSDALDFVNGFGQLVNVTVTAAFGFALTIVIGLVVILLSNVTLGVCMTVLLFILGAWTYRDNRKRSTIRSNRLKFSKKVTGHLSDNIVNAITVKTFAQETTEYQHAEQLSKKLEQIRIKDWSYTTSSESKRMGMLLLTQIILIFVLIKLSSSKPELLATGIFAFTYTITIISRFFTIGTMVRQIEEVFLQSSPMTEILMQSNEIEDDPQAASLQVSEGRIDIKDVSFHYSDSSNKQSVFTGLNLSIRPGEKIGLVGHSGGGKSTLTRLLLRFDDTTKGEIRIDDQPIKSVTQSSLRTAIAYVPQEPLLFHRSIKENISYAHPEATLDEITAAARMAHADDFIQELPDKYDTIVGERGVKLSGGQRQRIAIARAILKKAPILLLDEATSALDSESEALIQDALWNLMKHKTAIVIAHRLSTIQKMDRIIVLDHGKIVEEGTHKTLLAKNGIYTSLWSRQSGGFIEE